MIARETQTGRGLVLILTRPEAQRLMMIAARATASDQFGHQFRNRLLPILSQFGRGDPDAWRRVPRAMTEDDLIPEAGGRHKHNDRPPHDTSSKRR